MVVSNISVLQHLDDSSSAEKCLKNIHSVNSYSLRCRHDYQVWLGVVQCYHRYHTTSRASHLVCRQIDKLFIVLTRSYKITNTTKYKVTFTFALVFFLFIYFFTLCHNFWYILKPKLRTYTTKNVLVELKIQIQNYLFDTLIILNI